MRRREFLISAAAAASVASIRTGWAQGSSQAATAKASTLDRIAIMTLNFQSILKVPDAEENPNRTLELFDIGQMFADTYGVHKVEFQHYHLASTEPSYLKELRSRLEKSKSKATQINVEFSNLNMSAPRTRDRIMAVDLTKRWVEHAATIGAQRVMVNQGAPTPENKVLSIPALKAMADYGKSKGIIVSVETRGSGGRRRPAGAGGDAPAGPPPLTGPPMWALLAEIIKGGGASSNVDFGGAGATSQEELNTCLALMNPMSAGSVHTRVNPRWDLATTIKYLDGTLGYKGLYTIESSGGHAGTKEIYDVVVATL